MVYLLLAWCWILFITISLGVLFYHRVASRLFSAILVPLPVTLYSLVGSCFLAWILAVTSFFLRIGWEVQVALSLFSLLIWIKDWQFLKKLLINGFKVFTANKLTFWCFNLLALLILLHAVQPPTFPDSGLYHIQFIKWLREYPVIPGLGNLHGRLAFNSHLHLLSAFFSSAAFGILALEQAFGSYLFLLFAFWQVRLLARSLALKEKWAFFYLGGLLLVLLVFRNAISSPMPDSSLTIFILFLLSLVIEKIRNKTLPIFDAATFLIALILLTTFTFKISIIYLSLVLLYLGWQLPLLERIKYLKVFLPLALLILLPWVGR
ncbi:MAG: hypothetical protein JWQ14_3203, partial [Adhaeribacter sp.]|nr:hypothetical protein [Adhaeribacter sp.]